MESTSQIDTSSQGCSCGSGCCAGSRVQQVSTKLAPKDILGACKVRLGIKRMNYRVDPGLYCVGHPDRSSPVLVTANYKLSFDKLRSRLEGVDAWILVLDTKGINVWCAAGKGKFSTDELLRMIRLTGLDKVTGQRTLILPQLSASGVSAHKVARESGFKVLYGPVRADDLKQFLASGLKATPEMRTVKFTFMDRLVLTPMELVNSIKPLLMILGILFVLNVAGIASFGVMDFYGLLGALLCGMFLTPVLLPWIPFRMFYLKGWLVGLLWAVAMILLNGWPDAPVFAWSRALAYLLTLPAISAFCAMNFTGCSTYTSPSGVKREMKSGIPAVIISLSLGILSVLAGSLLGI